MLCVTRFTQAAKPAQGPGPEKLNSFLQHILNKWKVAFSKRNIPVRMDVNKPDTRKFTENKVRQTGGRWTDKSA
jgi:hypothetical protein